jgi:hypothetical protein
MTILQVAELPKPSKEFKDFCNSLRCPLCDGQLDGNIHPKQAILYCVNDNKEYSCVWVPNESAPQVETIKYCYPEYEYEISTTNIGYRGPSMFQTFIARYNAGVNLIYRTRSFKEIFNYRGPRILFFRKRMEEDVFLKKLKTYNVFS